MQPMLSMLSCTLSDEAVKTLCGKSKGMLFPGGYGRLPIGSSYIPHKHSNFQRVFAQCWKIYFTGFAVVGQHVTSAMRCTGDKTAAEGKAGQVSGRGGAAC